MQTTSEVNTVNYVSATIAIVASETIKMANLVATNYEVAENSSNGHLVQQQKPQNGLLLFSILSFNVAFISPISSKGKAVEQRIFEEFTNSPYFYSQYFLRTILWYLSYLIAHLFK